MSTDGGYFGGPTDRLEYSTLVALYGPLLPSKDDKLVETERYRRGQDVLQQLTDRVKFNLIEKQCFLGRDPENMSPWGLFFTYQIYADLVRSGRDDEDSLNLMRRLKETFLSIDSRWKAAGISIFATNDI